ncbi:hypothetical protein EDB86DRAFT_3242996 [Lactarius hatsudake]|nr:hypothetical protein EDB86DRAFT_3242996 [Lactarius hatsudake]
MVDSELSTSFMLSPAHWARASDWCSHPAKVIFAGAGVLLLAAKDVAASQDALVDIFERTESFFRRLEEYSEVPTTEAMKDIIVKIMVEVLGIFGIVMKEMKQGRTSELIP